MSIAPGYITNFNMLVRAIKDGNAMLMECKDVKTEQPVIVICAVSHEGGDEVAAVPFAKMFDGNPYEELIPPTDVNPQYELKV